MGPTQRAGGCGARIEVGPEAPERTPDQIESDLTGTRDRLVDTIAQLEDRLNPQKLINRQRQRVVDFYVSDAGPRWDHVAMTVAAVGAGLIGIRLATRAVHWAMAAPPPPPLPEGVVFIPVPREQLAALQDLPALPAA